MKQLYTIVIVLLCANYLNASSINDADFTDLNIVDVAGVEHRINQYLTSGKSIILNFSSTWCRPCWNYQNTGTLQQVWEKHGPKGEDDVVVILIEADRNTCEDCLYGQEDCNDFTYGDWSTSYPVSNLEDYDEAIVKRLNITKFPSIYAISAKDHSVTEVGQLSLNQWESWLDRQKVHRKLISSVKLKNNKNFHAKLVSYTREFQLRKPDSYDKASDHNEVTDHKKVTDYTEVAENIEVSLSWEVFPNPCVDQLSINSSQLIQSPVMIDMYDEEGSLIYSQHFEFYFKNWTIDMTDIPPGSYDLKVISDVGSLNKRIINLR